VLAVAFTAVAGAMLGAAFMATGRLWSGSGSHFGWNFVLGTVLSSAVSGHKSEGLLQGQLVGPDWLTGSAHGLEASLAGLLTVSLGSAPLIALVLKRGEVVLPYCKRSGDPDAVLAPTEN